MLSKESMDTIAAMIGVEADVLANAFSDEQEVKLDLPKGRFLTAEAEETLLDNHGKRKYDEGKSKASKDAFEGKSREDFLTGFKEEILEEAKIEPNKKLTEKDNALKALQDKYQLDIAEKEREIDLFKNNLKSIETNSKVEGLIPELRDGFTKSDARLLFNSSHEIKEDGVYKSGQLLVDDLQSPIDLKTAINNFITEKNWQKTEAKGHGGKKTGSSAATPKNYEEYQEQLKSKGIKEGSHEAKQILSGIREANPEFVI